jgi:hypothetical protein
LSRTLPTRPETLTDIHRAARFFYPQQHAFSVKVEGQSFGTATTAPTINLCRIEETADWHLVAVPSRVAIRRTSHAVDDLEKSSACLGDGGGP